MTRNTEQENIVYFDRQAGCYDEEFGLTVEADRVRLRFLQSQCQNRLTGHIALDIGCGTGNLGHAMAAEELAEIVVGVDISLGMVRVASGKGDRRGEGRCHFTVGSVTEMPFASNTFDFAVGAAFLHHILRPIEALREIFRVLKPGGVATFNEPCAEGYRFVEHVLRSIVDSESDDEGVAAFLHYLTYMREHEGETEALEACPLPDKHIFPLNALRVMSQEAGFSDCVFGVSLGFSQNHWHHYFTETLTAIAARPETKQRALEHARRLDELVGRASFDAFPVHTQVFLYKSKDGGEQDARTLVSGGRG